MNQDVTAQLNRIESGDEVAADELFTLVYDELRRLAEWHLMDERKSHTLQPTALVNEAYLRLVGTNKDLHFQSQKGFFIAAAEAMRHSLVEAARGKRAHKRG